MDGCSGFSPDYHTASISNIQLDRGMHISGQSCWGRQAEKYKKLQQPYKKGRCSRFSATKNHRLRTCRPVCFPHLSSSPDLRIFSSAWPSQGNPQWPAFALCRTSTHTVAVPSGIRTRFSILLRGCYHIRRHSNGIFTFEKSIHPDLGKVNRKKNNCRQKPAFYFWIFRPAALRKVNIFCRRKRKGLNAFLFMPGFCFLNNFFKIGGLPNSVFLSV